MKNYSYKSLFDFYFVKIIAARLLYIMTKQTKLRNWFFWLINRIKFGFSLFKNHTIQIFSMNGLPPSIFILSCTYWTLLCTAKLSWESKNTDRQMILQENGQLVFMCVFKFIHSCVWKGCVISCVFISYVSSNPLPKKKHSHIGCICLTFLHCGFANVPSNCLHEKNRGHIGCICMTFLQCGFSNVSSNRLPKKKHSHIGCICLTFLHCGFSNVFFFQIAWIRAGIVTLVAFVCLCSTVGFQMCL